MPSSMDPHAAASLPLTEQHCCMLLADPMKDRPRERTHQGNADPRGAVSSDSTSYAYRHHSHARLGLHALALQNTGKPTRRCRNHTLLQTGPTSRNSLQMRDS